jgi:hypothetical protein
VWRNGDDECVDVETTHVYPFLKARDLHAGMLNEPTAFVVPQTRLGAATGELEVQAPRLWHYLHSHAARIAARKSSIYRNAPPFALFGIGAYRFAQWKVAVAGLNAQPRFRVLGPQAGRAGRHLVFRSLRRRRRRAHVRRDMRLVRRRRRRSRGARIGESVQSPKPCSTISIGRRSRRARSARRRPAAHETRRNAAEFGARRKRKPRRSRTRAVGHCGDTFAPLIRHDELSRSLIFEEKLGPQHAGEHWPARQSLRVRARTAGA